MKFIVFEALGVFLILGSILFFAASLIFLLQQDYIAAMLAIGAGFLIIKMAIELIKISVLIRFQRPENSLSTEESDFKNV